MTICYGQSKDDKNQVLLKIKNTYQQTNNYKNYKTVVIDDGEEFLEHAPDNGATLTGYFKADSLKKIVEWIGLSNKVIEREYYFDKNNLIFVYSTESKYRFNDKTETFDYTKLDNVFKGRYYFDKDHLIDTILSDKEHNETKNQDAADFLTSSKGYLKLLSAKRK